MMLSMDEIILAACRAHTPQFGRMDPEIQQYAKEQMRAAIEVAVRVLKAEYDDAIREAAAWEEKWIEQNRYNDHLIAENNKLRAALAAAPKAAR